MIRKLKYGFILLALALESSCSQDDALTDGGGQDAPAATGDTKQQKVRLFIGGNMSVGVDGVTRAVPPGISDSDEIEGTCSVDQVALFVFRRKAGSTDEFTFDVNNSTEISGGHVTDTRALVDVKDYTATDENDPNYDKAEKNMKYVDGQIIKEKDYEYRIFALGYNTKRTYEHPSTQTDLDERDWFEIVDDDGQGINANTTLSEVKLRLVKGNYRNWTFETYGNKDLYTKDKDKITGYYVRTPEIFYGECYLADGVQNVITFGDDNELYGVLKRGVAQVTVALSELNKSLNLWGIRHVCELFVMLDIVNTEVHLDSYDRFNNPETIVKGINGDYGTTRTFTVVAGENECMHSKGCSYEIELTFYVLPTQKTNMSLRCASNGNAAPSAYNRSLWDSYVAVNSLSDGNQATGVIDPSSSGKDFYFRRNHKYLIKGTGNDLKATEE